MLLTYQDLQPALNIDLTDPNGQELADSLIAATQALLSGPSMLGFPIEQASTTESADPSHSLFWLNTTAPVTDLEVSKMNSLTSSYDTVSSAYVTNHGGRQVHVTDCLPNVPFGVRLSYTTGWTSETLPADLKQAIIDIVGIKLLEVANYSSAAPGSTTEEAEEEEEETAEAASGPLKKVVSIGYTEEYSTAESDAYWKAKTAQLSRSIGDNLPQSIIDTVLAYKPAFAL
jgi:hypothetical protein